MVNEAASCAAVLPKHDVTAPALQRPARCPLGVDRPHAHRVAGRAQRQGSGHRPSARARPTPPHGRHPLRRRRPHRDHLALRGARLLPFGNRLRQLNGLLRHLARKPKAVTPSRALRAGRVEHQYFRQCARQARASMPARNSQAPSAISRRHPYFYWPSGSPQPASATTGSIHLLSRIATATAKPRVTKAWVDTGYRTKAV